MAVEERSSDPASVLGQRRPNERREVDRTIEFWQQHRLEDDSPPLLTKFDFSKMRSHWAHRFLICSDRDFENAAFVAYGDGLRRTPRSARASDGDHSFEPTAPGPLSAPLR